MNTITKKIVGATMALMALAIPATPALAADFGIDSYDTGWTDTGYYDTYSPSYDTSTYDTGWTDTGYYDTYSPSYDTSWQDTGYYDTYDASYTSYNDGGSSYAVPSYGGSSFAMPTFGSANYNYRTGGGYPVFPTYPQQPIKPVAGNTTVTTNTCTNNSCNSSYVDNSIVDNSVKVSNSYNTQSQKKQKQQYNDCYGYNGNTQYGYGQQGYNYGSYNYQGNCYTYAAPIAYNTTPYITLSQAPYTGLDLGPMGEVLYWTFLVLWCLGAAYLIVVKRVQNKLVGFLNGFLFGTSAKTTVAHATHAPAHAHTVAASATLIEEGIDPFIQSQIKRS